MEEKRSIVANDIYNLLESMMNKRYQYNEYPIYKDDSSDINLSLVHKFLHDITTNKFLYYY